MNFLGKYSNGWGHLITTIAALAFLLVLLLTSEDVSVKTFAIGAAMLVIGYWFGAGSSARLERKEKDQRIDEQ